MSTEQLCQCLTTDGKTCHRKVSTKVSDNHKFCWQHQKCQNINIAKDITSIKSKDKNKTASENKTTTEFKGIKSENKIPVEIKSNIKTKLYVMIYSTFDCNEKYGTVSTLEINKNLKNVAEKMFNYAIIHLAEICDDVSQLIQPNDDPTYKNPRIIDFIDQIKPSSSLKEIDLNGTIIRWTTVLYSDFIDFPRTIKIDVYGKGNKNFIYQIDDSSIVL